MIRVPLIESVFRNLLQRDVVVSLNKKVLKQGKLTLFALKGFHLNLKLCTSAKKYTLLELPYPFSIKTTKTSLTLSYRPVDFAIDSEDIRQLLSAGAGFRKTGKLLNCDVIIEFL